MVDLTLFAPIIRALWSKARTGNFLLFFKDLNAEEMASWHAFRV